MQVQSVTLQTAILMQVKEFAQNSQQFSVHDITRTLRNKTAQGELEIPETETSSASFRFNIPHAKVKGLFEELWKTGVFDPDFTLSRNFNGHFWEYTPSMVSIAATVPTAIAIAPTTTATTTTASTTVDSAVASRISKYLTNCASRNFRPTLKKVQSAIKRGDASTGYSCPVLKNYIVGLGYIIVDDPEGESRAQVAVV